MRGESLCFRLPIVSSSLLVAALTCSMSVLATPQTVGDDACPKYAVDIAAFATCDGDKVTKPEPDTPLPTPILLVDDEGNPLPPRDEAIPRDVHAQTHHGHYLTARDAHSAKHWLGRSVLFIDVRDEKSVAATGLPENADFNLPVARRTAASERAIVHGFVARVKHTLAVRSLNHNAAIFVICEDGRNAALAAELLAQAGVPHVFVVRGGVEGERGEGDRAVTGWRVAQLPMRNGIPVVS